MGVYVSEPILVILMQAEAFMMIEGESRAKKSGGGGLKVLYVYVSRVILIMISKLLQQRSGFYG